MKIAGIDYSTKAVDLVTIPHEGDGDIWWHNFPLQGDGAFERARDVANALHGRHSAFWDDILAIGIEHPGGKWRDSTLRVQGAVLSCLPARTLVKDIPPGRWKKHTVGKGNASHDEYVAWAHDHDAGPEWNEDACAAYCIALYTRTLIQPVRVITSNIVRDGDTVFG